MTELERRAAAAISPDRVTYLPATWAKRFGRGMAAEAEHVDPLITDRQREMLWQQVYKFRRQIRDKDLVHAADRILQTMKGLTDGGGN